LAELAGLANGKYHLPEMPMNTGEQSDSANQCYYRIWNY